MKAAVLKEAGVIAIIFLMAMMLLTVVDVFLRYVFNAPILGSLELTEYFMICAGFFGIAWCAVIRGHVKVDLIMNHTSTRVQAITDTVPLVLAMSVIPIVAWQGFVQARYTQVENTVSDLLEVPDFPFYMVIGVSYALLFLVVITIVAEFIAKAVKK